MHKSTSLPGALTKALEYQRLRPAIVKTGENALRGLIHIALGKSGQSRVVGRFLLGLYNGQDYPFDLTDLRGLDLPLFEDCIKVLMMDFSPEVEVHERVADGAKVWAELQRKWATKDERAPGDWAHELAGVHSCWDYAEAALDRTTHDCVCTRCGAPLSSRRFERLNG